MQSTTDYNGVVCPKSPLSFCCELEPEILNIMGWTGKGRAGWGLCYMYVMLKQYLTVFLINITETATKQQLNTVLGFQTEVCYLQASGPLLLPLALGHLPVISSPSMLLTTTRQYSLEESNDHINILQTTKSMTVFLWILSQWYCQRYVIITIQMHEWVG